MSNGQHSQETCQPCGWWSPEDLPMPVRPAVEKGRPLPPELLRVVESDLVPRLLLLQRSQAPAPVVPEGTTFTTEHVEELARLLVAHDPSVGSAYIEMFRQNGVSTLEICLKLLPAAARHLGKLWEEDRCGFAEVTLGVSALHQILHWMTSADVHPAGQSRRNVLLSCMPGEQHTFGVLVVGHYLRRQGWDVLNLFPRDSAELLRCVKNKSFRIIGLSIGRDSRVHELKVLIRALRRASRNRDVALMVGGPLITLHPQIGHEVGADATALDAPEAASWAQGYWQSLLTQN